MQFGASERKESRQWIGNAVETAATDINIAIHGHLDKKVYTAEAIALLLSRKLQKQLRAADITTVRYFFDQLARRLRVIHNRCVVKVTESFLKESLTARLAQSVEELVPFVSFGPGNPAIALYVAGGRDGNLFTAYEWVYAKRRIGDGECGPVGAQLERLQSALDNDQLTVGSQRDMAALLMQHGHTFDLITERLRKALPEPKPSRFSNIFLPNDSE